MKKQTFLQGSVILIASVVIAKVIGAVFKIPLTNLLGGTGMGYFSSAYGLFLPVYAVAVTGLAAAVAKLTAENAAFELYQNARKVKNVALVIFSVIGLAGSTAIVMLAKPFAVHVVANEKAYLSLIMIAPSIFFGCISSVYRGYYEGLRNMYPTALSQVTEAAVKLAAGLSLCLFVLSHPGILRYFPNNTDLTSVAAAAAVFGVTLSTFAGMIYTVVHYRMKGDSIDRSQLAADKTRLQTKTILKELFKILIPVSVGSLVTNLTSFIDLATIMRCLNTAIEKSPQFFSEKYPIFSELGPAEFAAFVYGSFTGLAVTIFNLVPSVTNMFGKGVFPNIAEAWVQKDSEKLRANAQSALEVTGFISIPAGLGITVLAKEILTFLYPERLSEVAVSYESLIYLGLGVIMLSMSFPVFNMLQAIGRADIPVKIMLAGIAVKLLGNILLIPVPQINAAGAGISTLACYLLILVLSLIALHKITGVKLNFGKIFAAPAYSGVLCAAAAVLCSSLTSVMDYRISLVLSVAAGGIVYLFARWLLRN